MQRDLLNKTLHKQTDYWALTYKVQQWALPRSKHQVNIRLKVIRRRDNGFLFLIFFAHAFFHRKV